MQRIAVDSTVIASIGFDGGTNTLEVEFTTGRVYRYFAVPRSVVEAVLAGDSIGATFNRVVRGRYGYVEVQ